MSNGFAADPGKLNAVGSAYSREGSELVSAASSVETGIGSGSVGKAWSDVAKPYADAIARFRAAVISYGDQATELGGKLSGAADSYESGEDVGAATFARKG